MPITRDCPKDEVKKVRVMFELFSGGGIMDAVDVIDAVYGLELNPTQKLVKTITGDVERGEKFLTIHDFWDVYMQLKDNEDEGGFYDFVEIFKTFDYGENGLMKTVDLTSMLTSLGEKITEDEMWTVLDDCGFQQDDNGYFAYYPFLCRLCDMPLPKGNSIKPPSH